MCDRAALETPRAYLVLVCSTILLDPVPTVVRFLCARLRSAVHYRHRRLNVLRRSQQCAKGT